MAVREQLQEVQATLPEGVTLVAVSKTHPVPRIVEAYETGQRDFGENRVQELLEKIDALPDDARWHLIGHLQRNKVKPVVGRVALIHSVDSLRLLQTIDREACALGVVQPILLQVHVAQEETKFGLSPEDLRELLAHLREQPYTGIRVCGLMGMATHTDDEMQVRNEFRRIKALFEEVRALGLFPEEEFRHLSMGMSGDYRLAVDEGSTMVRVGSSIFGLRDYSK